MMNFPLKAGACALLAMLSGAAGAVTDAANDFLPTHGGANASDLDVLSADVRRFDFGFTFGATVAGGMGATAGASYVWGIDRGSGTAGLFAGDPPVGPGVTFDAVVVIRADGTGIVSAFNNGAPPTVTPLTDAVFTDADEIVAFVDVALLPSRGFALQNYRFNLWTRSGGGNIGIADLAQDQGTFGAVPEPASWALMIAGFGLVGATARRRRIEGALA